MTKKELYHYTEVLMEVISLTLVEEENLSSYDKDFLWNLYEELELSLDELSEKDNTTNAT